MSTRSTRGGDRPWGNRPVRTGKLGTTRVPFAELVGSISPELQAPAGDRPGALALWLPRGRWTPPVTLRRADLMLFVMSGSLLVSSAGGTDLLLEKEIGQVGVQTEAAWKVLSPEPALVAILTSTTIADIACVPGAAQALLFALLAQRERSVELRSIVCTYDVRERIVQFFAYLARCVGRSEGTAVRIPLALEQKRIEELVGAGHTQATSAFRSLVRAGSLVRDASGWLFDSSATTLAGLVPNPLELRIGSAPHSVRA